MRTTDYNRLQSIQDGAVRVSTEHREKLARKADLCWGDLQHPPQGIQVAVQMDIGDLHRFAQFEVSDLGRRAIRTASVRFEFTQERERYLRDGRLTLSTAELRKVQAGSHTWGALARVDLIKADHNIMKRLCGRL